jgi:hypothetical protein
MTHVLPALGHWGLLVLVVLAPLPAVRAVRALLERGGSEVSFVDRLLITLVTWTLLEGAVSLVLGATGHLDRFGLLLAETIVVLGGSGLAGMARRGRRGQPGVGFAAWYDGASRGERALAGLLGGEALLLLAVQLINPVTEYDSLAYHLPTIARWVQEGRFVHFEQFARDLVAAFPFTWEAVASLLVVPLHRDLLVALPSLFAWVTLGLAVYALAVRLGAARDVASAATVLLLNVPLLLDQTFAVRSDVALAAFFVAALEMSWWFRRTRSPVVAALAAACTAVVCATKLSGLAYALVLIAAFAALAWAPAKDPSRAPVKASGAAWMVAAIIGVLAIAVAGFWYARNLVEFGNPLGFVAVRIAGLTLFAGNPGVGGGLSGTTLIHLFDVGNLSHWLILGKTIAYFLGIPFVVLAALVPPVLARRERGTWLLAAVGACALALYLVTPRTGDAGDHGFQITMWIGQAYRYAFAFVAVVAVLAALGATRARLTGKRFLPLGGAAVAAALARPLFQWLMRGGGTKINSWAGLETYALAAVLSGIAVAAFVWVGGRVMARRHALPVAPSRPPSLGKWHRPLAGAAAVAAVAVLVGPVQALRERERQVAYEGIPECLSRVAAPGEAVGYLYTHRAYELFGSDLARRTLFLGGSLAGPGGARVGRAATVEEWETLLRRRNVRLVAIGPLLPEWQGAQEVTWLEDARGPFAPVCGTDPLDHMVVFRLER